MEIPLTILFSILISSDLIGITICDEWLHDRNTFCEWSLNNGFENAKGLSR